MRKYLLISLLAIVSFGATGQVTFQKTISGNTSGFGKSVLQASDGGYVIAGNVQSVSLDSNNIYLIKTNSIGTVIWTKTFDGVGNDEANKVEKTNDGGFIISGNTNSFGAGGYDVYAIKTDSIGDTLWTKTYGGVNDEGGYIANVNSFTSYIKQTTDGGYIISSSTKSFGHGGNDIYLIKTNTSGDTLWTRTFGSNNDDYGGAVLQTAEGGYIVTGSTWDALSQGFNECLIKINASGNIVWSSGVGNADGNMFAATSIFQTTDGGYVAVGNASDALTGYTFYITKSDSAGNVVWGKGYYLGTCGVSMCGASTALSNGNFIIPCIVNRIDTGLNYSSNAFLLKVDNIGNQVWAKSYGKLFEWEGTYQAEQTNDGGCIIIGYSLSGAHSDTYLIKTDSFGSSGCNEYSENSVPATSPPNVTVTPLFSSGSGCIVHSAPAQVSALSLTENNYCSNVGIYETKNEAFITIYPNPFSSQTTITFSEEQKHRTILITDVLGNIIQQQTTTNKQLTLDMSGGAKGIYFVRVMDGSASSPTEKKNVVNRKIVVE